MIYCTEDISFCVWTPLTSEYTELMKVGREGGGRPQFETWGGGTLTLYLMISKCQQPVMERSSPSVLHSAQCPNHVSKSMFFKWKVTTDLIKWYRNNVSWERNPLLRTIMLVAFFTDGIIYSCISPTFMIAARVYTIPATESFICTVSIT